MKRYALVAVWLAAVTIVVFGQTPQQKPATGPLLDDQRRLMEPEQVALTGTTHIFGDPAKSGLYIVRAHLAPNTKSRPRYYDQNRWVTVLKGTWWIGEGEVFRTEKLVAVREGGVMYLPANMKHYDMAGSGNVVLQIVGNGPVRSVHAELDAKGQPVPVGGPYPEDAQPEGGRRGRGGRRGQPPPPM